MNVRIGGHPAIIVFFIASDYFSIITRKMLAGEEWAQTVNLCRTENAVPLSLESAENVEGSICLGVSSVNAGVAEPLSSSEY